jgi:glycosyltransferase involved in cell wall biosynthesis
MLKGKKIAVTMPAYYAGKTVEKTYREIPLDIVDTVILVDDCSKDDTVEKAKSLGIQTYRNEKNLNYGGNVKRCLQLALDSGADVIVLLHPDYQYSPKLITAMAAMLVDTEYSLCLGSRTSGRGALSGGMPVYKYLANLVLTNIMDFCLGCRHTEYHTGYRAYTRELLEKVPFHSMANDFIFDNDTLVAAMRRGFKTCELTCPTLYDEDSSSISFAKSVRYGIQCLRLSIPFLFERMSQRAMGQKPKSVHD